MYIKKSHLAILIIVVIICVYFAMNQRVVSVSGNSIIIDTNEIDTRERESIEEIPEEIISMMMHFKNSLKDPHSLQIYGDIYATITKDSFFVAVDFIYNAKNSVGGYVGKERIHYSYFMGYYSVHKEYEDGFSNIISSYNTVKGYAESNMDGYIALGPGIYKREESDDVTMCQYIRIDGKELAEILGCEFIEYER